MRHWTKRPNASGNRSLVRIAASNLTKDSLQRVFETRPDPANGKPWKRVKFRPSLISYAAGGKRYEKQPDASDLEILERIEAMPLPAEMPTNRFPIEQMYHGSRIEPKGFTDSPPFFSAPRVHISGVPFGARRTPIPTPEPGTCCCSLSSRRYGECRSSIGMDQLHFSQVNHYLTGVYYVASQHAECSPWYILNGKLDRLD